MRGRRGAIYIYDDEIQKKDQTRGRARKIKNELTGHPPCGISTVNDLIQDVRLDFEE